jgi:hypothetical protein
MIEHNGGYQTQVVFPKPTDDRPPAFHDVR